MFLVALLTVCLLSAANAQDVVRLVGGTTPNEGRVEVYDSGEWGTVCDDGFDNTGASVVCRQLGLGDSGTAHGSAHFGEGSDPIILDDVACTGTEASIFDCPNRGLRSHNCGHSEDVGVICNPRVRLVGGATPNEGRVEVYDSGEWGTVCDDGFEDIDAAVVCRELDLGDSGVAHGSAHFGEGSDPIILDDVACTGTEASIFDCPNRGLRSHNCAHSEDVGVVCSVSQTVRLVGGATPNEGRVEVYDSGEWGTVCDDGFEDIDAGVVCRQLGLGFAGTAEGSAFFGEGSDPIILDDVACTGTETSIFDCPNRGLRSHNCGHSEDVGVICDVGSLVRLVGGATPNEGRVEVYNSGEWGTVCDDGFDDTDATVVCGQLGLGDSGIAYGSAHFGEGSDPIILDDVACTGTETSIFDCPNRGLRSHNCAHSEDVGVTCSMSQTVRLVGGATPNEGRVEVFDSGDWGTVCDDYFEDIDAGVVCQQLGFGDSGTAYGSAHFGQGTDPIILDDVECTGTEASIFDCPNSGLRSHNCGHSEDVGVMCDPIVRLVGGLAQNEGRVEVYDGGEWGTVCDDGFEDIDAGVVCRQLGLGDSGTAHGNANFGEGSDPIILDDVACTGTETSIFNCPNGGLRSHNCAHSEDVGVTCY